MMRERARQRLKLALASVVFLLTLGLCALGWLVIVYPDSRGHAGKGTLSIELAANATLADAADQLAAQQLVAAPRVFETYARVLGAQRKLRQGRVLLVSSMNARQLLARIARGFGNTQLRITIPEGFNRFDVAQRLADWNVCPREEFLRATEDASKLAPLDPNAAAATSTEGYLFPDTYLLADETPAPRVVDRLVDNARVQLGKLVEGEQANMAQLHDELGFGLHELITLASIVEKEAHEKSEQPIIAGVFLNRLRDPSFHPKRLQADPTVAYGCLLAPDLTSCAGASKRVTRSMTADATNLYNTYRLDGLPPGPIANPGLSAISAVLHAERHAYFYFVARGDGHHEFSTTLPAHNAAVQRFGDR